MPLLRHLDGKIARRRRLEKLWSVQVIHAPGLPGSAFSHHAPRVSSPSVTVMVSAALFRSLAALAFSVGVHCQGAGSCTETITARSGDTCASLAELAGISVTDFLRSNPSVTSCSALIGGAIYCKAGTATGPPTVPSPASVPSTSPSAPLEISVDGTCGGAVTCTGSRFGRCCSAYGFCGFSADHCGEGCQLGFGECGDASSKTIPATQTEQATIVVTETVHVTDTYTVRASTSVVTVTAVIPSTAIATSTSTVRATSTRRATSTFITTTATSTRRDRPATTTKSQGPPPKPSPVLPNTPKNCMLQKKKILFPHNFEFFFACPANHFISPAG